MAQTRGYGLNAAEASRLLDGYERSNLTRREYCEQVGIPVTTLDYYRRRQTKAFERSLLPVEIISPTDGRGFTVALSDGRRIESGWNFDEQALGRLLRVPEQI